MRESTPPAALRIPFVRRCVVRKDGCDESAMLLDLSVRGVYVASEGIPELGSAIRVSFTVPGNARVLDVPGTVAWVQSSQTHPVHGLPPGYGVHFTKLSVDDVRLLARTIRAYCLSNPIYRQYL